jgi:putative transposase
MISRVCCKARYIVIQELNIEKGYSISLLCNIADIARSSYYKWKNRTESELDKENSIILSMLNELTIP